jgi:hypothetical protein
MKIEGGAAPGGQPRGDVPQSDTRVGYICTFTGKKYFPLAPDPSEVDLLDIARALAMTCRYRGHCREFYSVAEHSVLVSRAVPAADALAGLLHDAPEAYLGDMASPIKRYMPEYRAIEDLNAQVIAQRFGLATIEPPSVKDADTRIIADEVPALFMDIEPFLPLPVRLGVTLLYLPPEEAFNAWLQRYAELTAEGSVSRALAQFRGIRR